MDNSIFVEEFKLVNKELGPSILKFIDENDIGDNVMLFYFASLVKESLKKIDDKDLKESVLTFMFDG